MKLKDDLVSGVVFLNRIDEILKKKGITRKAFAENLNIVPCTMAAWKTNDIMPPVSTIKKIADELDVTIDYLVTGKTFHFQKSEEEIAEWKRKSDLFDEISRMINQK